MEDVRELVQRQAREKWLNEKEKASLILGTGMGKSKVAIDILKAIDPDGNLNVLLLTNSETLRDSNWKAEFEKFGLSDYYQSNVLSECYQTVYKWRHKHFDLVIADEIDFAMTPMYSQFFLYNDCTMILGLTGFCSVEKRELLQLIAPVVFEYSTQQGQEGQLLNQSEIILIQYMLSKENTLKVSKKAGGHFMTSENANYGYYDKEFQKANIIKAGYDKQQRLGAVVDEKQYSSADWKVKIMATKRKAILNGSETSVKVVKELLSKIHATPGNKVLIFSALTSQADKFGSSTYHGKAHSTEKDLERLNTGEINTLAVCKAINRGVNLVGVNYIIRESFDSSETDFMQTHGRLMRLNPGQVAKYIILIPHYESLVRTETGSFKKMALPTQAARWANRMMASFDPTSTKTIVLGTDLKLPPGTSI
jgi:superfamily II DNA or RNA helicase